MLLRRSHNRVPATAALLILLAGLAPGATVLSENWETGTPPTFPIIAGGPQTPQTFNGWTSSVNSTQAPAAADDWVIWWWGTNGGGNAGGHFLASGPFGTMAAIADSGWYGNNDGDTTNQESMLLTSPAFSTAGFAMGQITYDICYRAAGSAPEHEWALEYSIDGGTAWSTVGSETGNSDLGTVTGILVPATRTIALPPAAAGQADVRLRWRFNAKFGQYAVVDNIVVSAFNQPINVSDASALEGDSGATSLSFPVTIVPAPAGNVLIDFAVNHGTTTVADFAGPIVGTFTFVGDGTTTTRELSIPVQGDPFLEEPEVFTLTLSNATSGDLLDAVATGTILDDDYTCTTVEDFSSAVAPSTPPTGWTEDSLNAQPANTWFYNNPNPRAILGMSGTFAIFDSNFLGNDSIPEDTALVSPTLDFSAGDDVKLSLKQCFYFLSGGRATIEGSTDNGATWPHVLQDSTFTIGTDVVSTGGTAETTVIAANQLAGSSTAKVRFRWRGDFSYFWAIDDVQFCVGTQPTGFSLVSLGNASVTEGAAALNIPVAVSPANAGDITVNYTITPGTATNPGDFTGPLTGSVIIAAPATSGSISIPLAADDSDAEAHETLTVSISTLSGGTAFLGVASASATITNNDAIAAVPFFAIDYFHPTNGATNKVVRGGSFPIERLTEFPYPGDELFSGGDFAGNDFSRIYAFTSVGTSPAKVHTLWHIDTVTGVETNVGDPGSAIAGTEYVAGLGWDRQGARMIALHGSRGAWNLSTVDTNTAAATSLGAISGLPANSILQGPAIDPLGSTAYVIDTDGTPDSLYAIDIATRMATLVGPTGVDNASYIAQFACIDATGELVFIAAEWLLPQTNKLYMIDKNTGTATELLNMETEFDMGQTTTAGFQSLRSSAVAEWTLFNN